jgi:hypothetical protein
MNTKLRNIKTLSLLISATMMQTAWADIPRTADGKPDLNGSYNVATLTPTQRPKLFGEKEYLTKEEADKMAADEAALIAEGDEELDPDRAAPPKGGDGNFELGAGGVGGYNTFWIDRGDGAASVDGKFRTSIVTEPSNGRFPEFTGAAKMRLAKRYANYGKVAAANDRAWWLEEGEDVEGPYDDPEVRTTSDRCLQGFGSTGGPPMLPTLYNNVKRIVQTPDHILILIEMVHDSRIVRMNSEHISPDIRKWMGDSIGHWEGDTLVIDTTNFNDTPGLYNATRDLHVVERFTRTEDALHYSFTVEDPNTWTEPWSGSYNWPRSEETVYEYACHEANYAMGNILRGARILEAEYREKAAADKE